MTRQPSTRTATSASYQEAEGPPASEGTRRSEPRTDADELAQALRYRDAMRNVLHPDKSYSEDANFLLNRMRTKGFAIEAEAAATSGSAEPEGSPAGLDVERMAEAWHMTQRCVHGKGSGEPMQTPGYLNPDREVARDLLDEYARLTSASPQEAEDDR